MSSVAKEQANKQATRKVGLVICSTRTPRCAPQIASFIQTLLTPLLPSSPSSSSPAQQAKVSLETFDLLDWPLPLHTNEPDLPVYYNPSSLPTAYATPITQRWSAHILSFSAFIFITPQYNWGYPASIKNALDHLYHEWVGKPVMVVSYGGRGGQRGGEQLVQVLQGLKMKPIQQPGVIGLPFRGESEGMQAKAEKGEDLGLADEDGDGDGVWKEEREQIVQGFQELLASLEG